ncbi:hypothetical protein ACWCQK_42340 [Streptomyces sp. NPDC002306]
MEGDEDVDAGQGLAALPDYTRYDHGGSELVMNWLMPQGMGTGFDGLAIALKGSLICAP